MRRRHTLRFLFFIFVGLLGALILFLYVYPIKTDSLISHSRASNSFQESLQRIDSLQKSDSGEIDPAASTILMHHGSKVERVIVFFHGFTNSPRQFKALGEQFYKLGYNVFIPRVPHHGLKKPRSTDLEKLTAEDMVTISDEAIDIAQGLGDHVIVAGISMGGVMAGWAAQVRHDVDKAVLIAPNFGTYKVPDCFLKPSINFLLMRPNSFVWWDSKKKQNLEVPETAYYGFPSRALGEIRRLGWYVQILAKKSRPEASKILVVTNANDRAVSKEGIDVVVNNWKKDDSSAIQTYEFPSSLNLGHDLIDPEQPNQNISVVYPKLISLMIEKGSNEK